MDSVFLYLIRILTDENTNNSAIPPLSVSMQSSVELTSVSFSLCQKSLRDGTTVWASSEIDLAEIDVSDEEDQLELSAEEMTVQPSSFKESPKETLQMSTDRNASVPYGVVGGCLLRRPALWEHDLWQRTPFDKSKTELHSPEAAAEDLETASTMVVCCDVQIQTSLSTGSGVTLNVIYFFVKFYDYE